MEEAREGKYGLEKETDQPNQPSCQTGFTPIIPTRRLGTGCPVLITS